MKLLHTTLPTISKYTEAGLLKCEYFGTRVLYPEDEINLALPNVKSIIVRRKKLGKAA